MEIHPLDDPVFYTLKTEIFPVRVKEAMHILAYIADSPCRRWESHLGLSSTLSFPLLLSAAHLLLLIQRRHHALGAGAPCRNYPPLSPGV